MVFLRKWNSCLEQIIFYTSFHIFLLCQRENIVHANIFSEILIIWNIFTAYILFLMLRAWYRLLYDSGDFGAGNNMWRWLPGIGISKKNVKLFYFEFEIFWGVESELEKVSQKILNDLIIKRCSFGRFAFYWGQKFGNTKYRADRPHIGFCTLPSNYHWVYWSPHGSTWYKW